MKSRTHGNKGPGHRGGKKGGHGKMGITYNNYNQEKDSKHNELRITIKGKLRKPKEYQ